MTTMRGARPRGQPALGNFDVGESTGYLDHFKVLENVCEALLATGRFPGELHDSRQPRSAHIDVTKWYST